MPSLTDLEQRIRSIAAIASNFKIGKTSQHVGSRLAQHAEYSHIVEITWSKYKQNIDYYEEAMLEIFLHWKNCDNKNYGSAARMPTTDTYSLYVVYNPRKRR